jgi:DNA-binding transcriptional regulator YhcF (GntR family)
VKAVGPVDPALPTLRIHSQGDLPLYLQIKHQLAYLITTSRLPGGTRLPTVRALAADLAINQNTVGQAYRELQTEGLIESFAGRGTFVRQFDDASAAESARLERLTTLLRTARRQARALGFSDRAIEQHLTSLVNHEQERCRMVFVDRVPHIAKKYAERLEHFLGDRLEVTPLSVEDLEAGTPESRAALIESYYVIAFARNVPALERLLAAGEQTHELVTIVSEVVPDTVAMLATMKRGTKAALLTEERFVHAALDLLARHSEIDPNDVEPFTPDDVAGFVRASKRASVAFYTFSVTEALGGTEVEVPTFELVFDVSPDSIAKIARMVS